MQPIILLGVVAVAAALIGTGFLGTGGNIVLWVQSLGWGEQDLQAPISHAFIDLNLKKLANDNGTPVSDCEPDDDLCIGEAKSDDYFDNVISSCSFHSDDDIRSADTETELSPGVIICKLTDDRDRAIAEGRILLNGQADPECPQSDKTIGYESSQHLIIDICQTAFPGANDVQKVTDVKIVVEGALDRSMN
jgi:hypothetical protein